ncbi:MAG: histone deacetylase [Acidobacteria bacterium]|nr:histone deacetylase [Acidobacteriota bacterium]MCZ6727656.1 histone deacetylase [Acidobacteriota bacterium]
MGRVFTSERCQQHAPPGFPERPARLEAVLEGARAAGWESCEVGSHGQSAEAVQTLHAGSYVARFERAMERGDGLLDSADNPLSPGTWTAAWAAVDCSLAAADWVAGGPGRQSFAAVRPPGHHAESGLAMGFCFFGNVALAADHLIRVHGCQRVAVFDFDVHHGNGTQQLLEERGDVFFASVHQYPFYPGTGAAEERGCGSGEGMTLNVPLPAGTDDEALRAALETTVLPDLRAFAPEIILVSAGFDGWVDDPIGGWRLTEAVFTWLGAELGRFAAEICEGRILTLLEGGYSLDGLRRLTESYLRAVAAEAGAPSV